MATDGEAFPKDADSGRGSGAGGGAETSVLRRGINKLLAHSMMAAAPFMVSCSADDQTQTAPDTNQSAVTENVDDWRNRLVFLWFDRYDWHFQGHYPENFKLQVFASTEAVIPKPNHTAEDMVYQGTVDVAADGSFNLHDYSGSDETVWITIKAFKENGREITISPNPGSEGMFGVPSVANIDKLP